MTYYGGSLRGPREAIEDKMSSMKQVSRSRTKEGIVHFTRYWTRKVCSYYEREATGIIVIRYGVQANTTDRRQFVSWQLLFD
jgi:hypothetical protein